MIKGWALSAAVVLGIAALADRGLAVVAGDAAAASIARSGHLGSEPDVSFRGFPFLTQALRGRFAEVDVDAREVPAEGVTFSRIEVELRGVEVGLRDALSGEVEAVPISSGDAVVHLDYADLNAYLEKKPGSPRAAGSAGALSVRSTITVAGGGTVEVEGRGSVRLTATGIVVRVTAVRAVNGPALPAAVAATAGGRMSFTVPTGDLPFGIVLTEVAVTDRGLRITALAEDLVVEVR